MTDIIKAKVGAIAAITEGGGSVFFAITDAVSIAIVTGIVAIITGGVSAYFAYKVKTKVTVVESKVDTVESKVDTAIDTGEKVYKLVDGAMTTQLQLNAVMSRRLAAMTKSKIDIAAAKLSEKTLRDHEASHP